MGVLHCRISNMFLLKIHFNQFRFTLTGVQVFPHILDHFFMSVGTSTSNSITLNIMIQHFVRVQLRAIRLKIKKFNLFRMCGQPRLNFSRSMSWMSINNQKKLTFHN